MPAPEPEPTPFPRPRRSASAKRSLAAEMERVRAMSVEERIKAALSMRERFNWLQPAPESGERR